MQSLALLNLLRRSQGCGAVVKRTPAKSENLGTSPGVGLGGSPMASNFNASLGNALLNLASLSGLSPFPNLLSGSVQNSPTPSGGQTPNAGDLQRGLLNLLSQQQNMNASTMSAMAALHSGTSPLNLTSGTTGGSSASGLGVSQLAQLINQQQNAGSYLNSSPSNSASPTMPQLLLASGQILQGIQGAQLLIPTSQGLMAQSILTIPLAQPGSPPAGIFPPAGSPQLPPQSASGLHHASARLHRDRPSSPKVSQLLRTSSSSPDFLEHHSTSIHNPGLMSQHAMSGLDSHIPMMSDKLEHQRSSVLNDRRERSSNGPAANSLPSHNSNHLQSHHHNLSALTGDRRDTNAGSGKAAFPGMLGNSRGVSSLPSTSTLLPLPKMSPCSPDSQDDSDKFSDNDDDQMVDGINLDEIKEFAKAFKLRRLSLGLTQTQVGQALSVTEGPAYSQSAICSALAWQLAQSQNQSNRATMPQPPMFEKLDITPKSAQKIKPVLERWMKEAEERYKHGHQNLNEFVGMEPSKKRKRRTSFTPQALEILNTHFERNTHPSGAEITTLAHQLGYEREVIRIWFCNKRQALKNTVRMMSKGGSPV